jgi:predicted GNAT family acetyltransferase
MTLAALTLELLPFTIRPMRPDEVNFVASTWVRSYLSSPWAVKIQSDEYFEHHSRIATAILSRGIALVAEHSTYGTLLGHAVGERTELGPVFHYAYTKGDFRKRGVARALETALLKEIRRDNELVRFTHKRAPGDEVARRRGYRWSPYMLYPKERR